MLIAWERGSLIASCRRSDAFGLPRAERVEDVHARWLKSPAASSPVGTVRWMCRPSYLAQAFIIGEEECLLPEHRTAERRAEIVLHQKFPARHFVEAMRIQRSVAQELVRRAVKLRRAASGDDVDLAAARAAHSRPNSFRSAPEIRGPRPATG